MGSLCGLGWPCKQELWRQSSRALAKFTLTHRGVHRGTAPCTSSCPSWDALGGFTITNLGTTTSFPSLAEQTRV